MDLPCGRENTFFFRPALREAWKRGELVAEWSREYPFLFDLDNRRNAQGQCHRGYHFGEWFTAITLFRRHGLHSIVNKYAFRSHKWKTETFERIVIAPKLRAFLRGSLWGRPLKRPDLLVYKPNLTDYCFIEVKQKDRLKPLQRRHFAEIERQTGSPWGLVYLRPCPVPECTDFCFKCDGPPAGR